MSARANDQQVGVASLLDEHLSGLTHAHHPFDLNAVGLVTERGERCVECRARALLEHSRIDARRESAPAQAIVDMCQAVTARGRAPLSLASPSA